MFISVCAGVQYVNMFISVCTGVQYVNFFVVVQCVQVCLFLVSGQPLKVRSWT